MKKIALFLFISLSLISCVDENQTPEGALKSFIEARMGKVVTRDYIMERVTGKMQASLESMSDEDFAKFSDLKAVEKNGFKILTKSCQEKKCFITYSVSFITKDDKASTFNSDVKKIAELLMIDGKWLIADVSNIKTYHEALEPINPLE